MRLWAAKQVWPTPRNDSTSRWIRLPVNVRSKRMFLGLRTAVYYVADIDKARAWYSSILGQKPYFDEPFYVGYNVGGFELGLHPDEGRTKGEGHAAYWGVDNAEEALG